MSEQWSHFFCLRGEIQPAHPGRINPEKWHDIGKSPFSIRKCIFLHDWFFHVFSIVMFILRLWSPKNGGFGWLEDDFFQFQEGHFAGGAYLEYDQFGIFTKNHWDQMGGLELGEDFCAPSLRKLSWTHISLKKNIPPRTQPKTHLFLKELLSNIFFHFWGTCRVFLQGVSLSWNLL